MTVDVRKLPGEAKAISTSSAKIRTYAIDVADYLVDLETRVAKLEAPATPPPPSGPGFWDASKAVRNPNSDALIQNLLRTAGDPYFIAGVARATALPSTGTYAIPITNEPIRSIAAPVPVGTQPGHTNDLLLIVTDPVTGTRYCFSGVDYNKATGKLVSCYGATIVTRGVFTEPGPNSTSAGRLPFGFITPEDYAADVMAALTFSTMNVGHGAAVYPASTDATDFPGTGAGLPVGSWISLPVGLALDPALTRFENYVCRRLQRYGAFLRDVGDTFGFYGSDQVNQGGQAHDWAAVGVTLEVTNLGYPYAHRWSQAFRAMLTHLQLLLPPPVS